MRLEREVIFGSSSTSPLWHVRGPAPADKVLSITVMLVPNPAAIARLEAAFWSVSDPDDATNYGQHWSQRDVTKAVGNQQGCDAVTKWLIAGGAVDVRPTVHRDGVQAEVRVDSAATLLNATFFDYEHALRGVVLSRVGAGGYSVPAALADVILLIEGVGRLPALRLPHVTRTQPKAAAPAAVAAATAATAVEEIDDDDDHHHDGGDDEGATTAAAASPSSSGKKWPRGCGVQVLCSTTPATLFAAYELPRAPANASEAHGASLGVAEFQKERWDQPDFDEFSRKCHVDPPVKVDHSIGAGGKSIKCRLPMFGSSDCGEALLDIQYAKALIGAIPLTNVYATDYSILTWAHTVSALNDSGLPTVQSVSYGMDESMQVGFNTSAYLKLANIAFMQLGVRGVSLLVASGDSGVCGIKGCDTYDPGVNFTYSPTFPSTSPYVTSVGATNFQRRSAIGPEEAWDNSGGGFSNYFGIPPYQKAAVDGYLRAANASLPNRAWWNQTGRGYPDVSALGGDRNSFCIAGGSLFAGTWGTSASSPVVASMIARLNAHRLARGKKVLGFLNPWIYKHAAAFNDVTKGCNDHEHKKNGGFAAVKGWDPATGVGTPNWPKLLKAALA